ncbi:MCE family protein [bacterium]|nr:MCE family protein [bacterium]QQR58364.1 MAG: MCE family protein [Candidatus Melainabacteria bacterium]
MAETNEINKPEKYNMSEHKLLENAVIGMFVSVAIIILVWSFCWWRNLEPWNKQQIINVDFPEVAGLSQNASVLIDGTRIGRVDKVEWEGNNRVLVQLRISSPRLKVRTDAKFMILTDGIVGSKYVEIVIPDNSAEDLPILADGALVKGEMPARPELAIQKLSIGLSHLDPEQMVQNYREDRKRVIRAADQLALLADKAIPVIDHALPIEHELLPLTKDLNKLTNRLARLLDNPRISQDLKDTVKQAQNTITSAKQLITQIDSMVHDKDIKEELRNTLNKLEKSTDTMFVTVSKVEKITDNKELREDVKEILTKTRTTLDKADTLLNKPILNSNMKATITNAQEAVENINTATKQLTTILDKRFPLIHMMIGRPGRIKKDAKPKEIDVRKEVEIERKKLDLESPVTPVTPVSPVAPLTPTELEPKLELKPEIKSE